MVSQDLSCGLQAPLIWEKCPFQVCENLPIFQGLLAKQNLHLDLALQTEKHLCCSGAVVLLHRSLFIGASLAVQWLRLHASTAVGTGSIPVRGTKVTRGAAKQTTTTKKNRCLFIKHVCNRMTTCGAGNRPLNRSQETHGQAQLCT